MSMGGKYWKFINYRGNIHSNMDRVRMHNFEPKIEDLTGFNNYGDTLMKEEFVYLGNTSSCSRQL